MIICSFTEIGWVYNQYRIYRKNVDMATAGTVLVTPGLY